MKCTFLALCLAIALSSFGQSPAGNNSTLVSKKEDAEYVLYKWYRSRYSYFEERNRDSAIVYAQLIADVATRNKKILAANYAMTNKAYQLNNLGQYGRAFQIQLSVMEVANDARYDNNAANEWPFPDTIPSSKPRYLLKSYAHHMLGQLMWQTDNNPRAIEEFKEAEKWGRAVNSYQRIAQASMNIARGLIRDRKYDTAKIYCDTAMAIANRNSYFKYVANMHYLQGDICRNTGKPADAEEHFRAGIESARNNENLISENANAWALCSIMIEQGRIAEALPAAMENLALYKKLGPVSTRLINIGVMYENIYKCYEQLGNRDSTLKYQSLALKAKDSINAARLHNITMFQNQLLDEQVRLKNQEKERILYENRIRNLAFFGGLASLALIAFILYRNNRQKQKANKVLEATLTELKDTQSQLIHAEKMASLGELTAGIAHEIQNPLNFVNNFSEINKDLLADLRVEQDPALREEIINDLSQNVDKVIHHGKRADTIVKGMLSHSRKSAGERRPVDLNALCDEYAKIAYHSLMAKGEDERINVRTSLESNLPQANIVPQEIGRVVLNLVSNACYAVAEKAKKAGVGYEPLVNIRTARKDQMLQIVVEDNGTGIPDAIREKIFQPFFTTKPTGSGTGLGLSLSYDVVKAHKGNITVESKDGKGTVFTVSLPLG